MSDEETIPVEQDDLAEQLAMEKERLDKLYVAYQAIESELADAKAHIEVLETVSYTHLTLPTNREV